MSELVAEVRLGVAALTAELLRTADDDLVAVYVHGSAVLGDFVPGASDLDVLVVVRDDTERQVVEHVAQVLNAADVAPATGIEASVVTAAAARRPVTPWPYRVHVATSPANPKIVWCTEGEGDDDLALHYTVARTAGWPSNGSAAERVIGAISPTLIRRHLVAELRWSVDHAPMPYAVLNACRALRWDAEGVVCSKSDGGEWALEHDIASDLVGAALAARHEGDQPALPDTGKTFVLDVAARLEKDR